MKQICAWCETEIYTTSQKEGSISYGICLHCANDYIIEVPHSLRDFLEQISVPVVLVDMDGVIRFANNKTAEMLQKGLPVIEGNLGGDVFECAYTSLPGGCGNTVHCSGCAIRRTVMQTHQSGKGVSRVPATLKQSTPEEPQDVKLLISTEKFGQYVVLKIFGDEFSY